MKKVIFPGLHIEEGKQEGQKIITIETYIRKYNDSDGMWYLQLMRKSCSILEKGRKDRLIKDFIEEVYTAQVIGRVMPSLIDPDTQEHIFEVDEDQRSEEERITDYINNY